MTLGEKESSWARECDRLLDVLDCYKRAKDIGGPRIESMDIQSLKDRVGFQKKQFEDKLREVSRKLKLFKGTETSNH